MWLRIAVLAIVLAPGIARADMVWPALYLVSRLFTWWAIAIGLLIEFVVIRIAFALPPRKAILADIAANAASSLVGAVVIAIGGLIWEFGPGQLMYKWLNVGTFNPFTWGVTIIVAALVNAVIETFVLTERFDVPFSRRTFIILTVANAVTVGIAFASVFIAPVEM